MEEPQSKKAKKTHACTECTQTFSRPCRLHEHLKSVHNITITVVKPSSPSFISTNKELAKYQFPCTNCHRIFARQHLLKAHIEKEHSTSNQDEKQEQKSPEHVCIECNKTFNRPSKLQDHIRIHHAVQENLTYFDCPICGMSFLLKDYLRKHLKSHKDAVIC